jgi:AraC-like DNA-binding protein
MAGSCWLEVGEPHQQVALQAGDLVLLTNGSKHWMRDEPDTPAIEVEDILDSVTLDAPDRLTYGGDGSRTSLLCGGFTLDGSDAHPILRTLPALVHIRGNAGRPVAWLAATLGLLDAECASDAPGSHEVVTRLADAFLTQALRVGLAELDASDHAGLRVFGDPQIASAIELIHRQPERAWTIGELAHEVALSRSAFAARFRQLVGESPKRYVTRTHLAHAAGLLHKTRAPLSEIATRAGYANEFSFGKAFKRTFGVAPGAYRGESNGAPQLTRPADATVPAHAVVARSLDAAPADAA